ncbi:MAG: SbcC/MukB-like Walker B domain-containing protein [Terrimicrobiaceae bacterium]
MEGLARLRAAREAEQIAVRREHERLKLLASYLNAWLDRGRKGGLGDASLPERSQDFDPDEPDNARWAARLQQLDDVELPKFRSLATQRREDWERRLLDYRHYHRYDIEMMPRDDPSAPVISLSRSLRSLSGGENQAPFFLSMLAAFRRVYDLGSERSRHLGLVVMDEAFSKLSGDGVEDCLELARNFGLQLVIAFPSNAWASWLSTPKPSSSAARRKSATLTASSPAWTTSPSASPCRRRWRRWPDGQIAMDPVRWRSLPVLRDLHSQWWNARGGRVGRSRLPFSRDWERLLEDAGLTTAELRAEAERDARELCAAGLVELKPPRLRPQFIERVRIPIAAEERLAGLFGDPLAAEKEAFDPAAVAWEPELAFLGAARVGVPAEDLLKLNRFLAAGGRSRPRVPAKERSLTIFGNEKRLDALRGTALFRADQLSLDVLRCESVAEPLGWKRGPQQTGQFLVLENAATFHSFARWNAKAARFSAVIYGGGYRFVDSVAFLPEIAAETGDVERVLYFGDLDPEGLRIPHLAGNRASTSRLPPVEPFLPAYKYLFALPDTCRFHVPEEDATEDHTAWLGDLAGEAIVLFRARQRIAQEWLGWESLSHGDSL